MTKSTDPREEALKRLDDRLDALAEQQARKPIRFDSEGSGAGYRLIGELIGGVLGGLGLGWIVDRIAGTSPWGSIVGVLAGAAVSVFAVARSAGRMSASAEPGAPAAPALEDDDDRPSGLGG